MIFDIVASVVIIAFMIFLFFHKSDITFSLNINHNYTYPETKPVSEEDLEQVNPFNIINAMKEATEEILGGESNEQTNRGRK